MALPRTEGFSKNNFSQEPQRGCEIYPFQQKEDCSHTLERVSLCLKPPEVTGTIVAGKCLFITVERLPFRNAGPAGSRDPSAPASLPPSTPSPDWGPPRRAVAGPSGDLQAPLGSRSQTPLFECKSAHCFKSHLQSPVVATPPERGPGR